MKKTVKLCCNILLCLSMALGICGCSSSNNSKEAVDKKQENSKRSEQEKSDSDTGDWLKITYQTVETNPSEQDMEDTIYKLKTRAEAYTAAAEVLQEGNRRIIVELPGIKADNEEVFQALGKPGSIEFVAMSSEDGRGETVLSGEDIRTAEVKKQENAYLDNTGYEVELILTDEGAEKFKEVTMANIGKTIWVMYDGKRISAPTVGAPIMDGRAVISGLGSEEEAEELATHICIGALSLELEAIDSTFTK